MDTAKIIKELRESTGMSRKEFSVYTGIPVRTLEDWEAGRRTPPEYIPRLLTYRIKLENKFALNEKTNGKISIITDPDGKQVVLINDIRFKSRRSIDWNEIEQILKKYIGKYYEIVETAEKVYIGSDFPDEYTHSKYTKAIKGANVTIESIWHAKHCSDKSKCKDFILKNAIHSYPSTEYMYSPTKTLDEMRKTYKWSCSSQNSVPLAIRCVFEANSYEEFIRNVLSFKCDTDTICAIGGGIAEELFGGTGFDNEKILKQYLPPELYNLVMIE